MLEKIATPVRRDEVLRLLSQHYGLSGELQLITGERDYNFLLTQKDATRMIVKIAHDDEAFETLDFQSQVIARLQRYAPPLPLSAEIANLAGKFITIAKFNTGSPRLMRVNEYVNGTPLCDVPLTVKTRHAVGRVAAHIALALLDFRHPSAERNLLWDIQRAAALVPHVEALPLPLRNLVYGFYNTFLRDVAPLASQLRHRVIHNDLNLHNLFVSSHDHGCLTGCIDFGDMVYAPMINDLAIAAAYQMDPSQPLQSIGDVAHAYHCVNPLRCEEVDVLFNLVAMRFVLTVAITHWRSKLHPENATYILRNVPAAVAGLEAMQENSPVYARDFFYEHLKPRDGNAP